LRKVDLAQPDTIQAGVDIIVPRRIVCLTWP